MVLLEAFGTVPTLVLLGTVVLLLIFHFFGSNNSKNVNLPPGPSKLKLFFLLMKPDLDRSLMELSKKYGEVFSIGFAKRTVIHLGSYEAIKEAFIVNKGEEFTGRMQTYHMLQYVTNQKGVIVTEGEDWKAHRRFILTTLRDFGFGKSSMEERVQNISRDLLEELRKIRGTYTDVSLLLANSTANAICSILLDKQFDFDDPEFVKIRNHTSTIIRSAIPGTGTAGVLPQFIVKLVSKNLVPPLSYIYNAKTELYEIINKYIREHEETFSESYLRDFVDVYIAEKEKKKFKDGYLDANVVTLLAAGTETTSTTLYWALRFMIDHQDVQEKIQEELDRVVGRERLPALTDRSSLPFTEATILEVQRMANVTPILPPHCNNNETTILGHTIPARSVVLGNATACHRDPKYWPEPEKFDPTRFLEPDGTVNKNKDAFLPFGLGKRNCLGETLAKMELFLFFGAMMQNFNFISAKDDLKSGRKSWTEERSLTLSYELIAEPRKD